MIRMKGVEMPVLKATRQLCFTCGQIQKVQGTEVKYVCEVCDTIHYIPRKSSFIMIKTQRESKKERVHS